MRKDTNTEGRIQSIEIALKERGWLDSVFMHSLRFRTAYTIGFFSLLFASLGLAFTAVFFMLGNLNTRMDRMEFRMDRIESRMDRMESRMDRIESKLDLLLEKQTQAKTSLAK